MLLRRITKHVTDQNWFAVFIDFLIVVVGVFIGIQVSNWNQLNIDRKDEAVLLQDLHADVVSVQNLSKRLIVQRRERFEELSDLVDTFSGGKPTQVFDKQVCFTMLASNIIYVGRAELPSLIQLRSAGRMNIIADAALQRALAKLTQSREALDIVSATSGAGLTSIFKNFSQFFEFGSELIPDISNPGQMERNPLVLSCEVDQLLESVEVRNALAINLEFFDAVMRDGIEPWVAQLQAVHQRLDELLEIQHDISEVN